MKRILFFLTLCVLQSCIKPFDFEVDEGAKKLVVNGMITNEPGPYTVKINKTTSYGGHFSDVHDDILKAQVTITDDLGAVETLKEFKPGEFVTDLNGIQGRIGGKYTLRIKLKNGEEYVSETETLPAVSNIDRFYYQYKEVLSLNAENNEVRSPYFEMRVDLKDAATEKNYYRWVSLGTYEVETQPENFTTQDKNGNPRPAPKNCCRQCWVRRVDYSAAVTSDRDFDGKNLIGMPVANIPITPQFFGIKYHIELKQYSISEKVFYFWKTLESQTAGTGSVQDPAPANARGNITNINNPDEQVLGYFGASGVITKTMYLGPQDVPFSLSKFIYPDDCRLIPSATTIKPSFWQ